MAHRRSEDLKAAASLAAVAEHGDFLDAVYRRDATGAWLIGPRDRPTAPLAAAEAELVEAVTAKVGELVRTWRPGLLLTCAGVGGHVDHLLARQAVQTIADLTETPLELWTDLPYASDSAMEPDATRHENLHAFRRVRIPSPLPRGAAKSKRSACTGPNTGCSGPSSMIQNASWTPTPRVSGRHLGQDAGHAIPDCPGLPQGTMVGLASGTDIAKRGLDTMEFDLDAAVSFVTTHARVIERRRLHHLLNGGSSAGLLAALDAYRNPNGGYGWGLEPDQPSSTSQPVATMHALEVLASIHDDTDRAPGICDWLGKHALPDGGIPFGLPYSDTQGAAPHWMSSDTETSSLQMTAQLAAQAHRIARRRKDVADHP